MSKRKGEKKERKSSLESLGVSLLPEALSVPVSVACADCYELSPRLREPVNQTCKQINREPCKPLWAGAFPLLNALPEDMVSVLTPVLRL